MGKCGES
jgi:hypothetical protein